eukprot:TRINITY_DN72179_c0_g1_i1.p1 TRINITY_DN72179_c0_g1~~TRINITY_DN72179_c0_g1_i1.p1  ORF type:complete len:272 (+),score=76.63 TRINITY_DN72179_c0_g1_i1:88-903(+)
MGGRGSREADAVTWAEVERHNTKEDAWLVLFGEAIDVTKFVPMHPGGEESIAAYFGKDATEDWQMIHSAGTLEKYVEHLVKKGKVSTGGLWGWLLRRLSARGAESGAGDVRPQSADSGAAGGAAADADEMTKGLQWAPEHDAQLPSDGIFTLDTLSRWDGVQLPMLIGLCGLVVDVSTSDNFVPNHGYGKIWAGKDTTLAMATVSLKAHDANRLDFKLDDLEEAQIAALAGWYKHFTCKYRTVGTLKELVSRDFSPIEMRAEYMPAPTLGS